MAIYPPVIDNSVSAFPCKYDGTDVLKIYFYFQGLDPDIINSTCVFVDLQEGGDRMFASNDIEPFLVWADEEVLFTENRFYIEIPVGLLRDKYKYYYQDSNKEKQGFFTFPKNSLVSVQLMALGQHLFREKDSDGKPKIDGNGAYIEDVAFIGALQRRMWSRPREDGDKSFLTYSSVANYINSISVNGGYEDVDQGKVVIPQRSEWSSRIFKYPIEQPSLLTWGNLDYEQVLTKDSLYAADKESVKLSIDDNNSFTPKDRYRFKSEIIFNSSLKNQLFYDENLSMPVDKEDDVIIAYNVQLSGLFSQEDMIISDETEEPLSAVFTTLEETKNRIYIDNYWDSNRLSFTHTLNYDFGANEYQQYQLLITYYTRKGYQDTAIYYIAPNFTQEDVSSSGLVPHFTVEPLSEIGVMRVSIDIENPNMTAISEEMILDVERAIDDKYDGETSATSYQQFLKWETCYQERKNVSINAQTTRKKVFVFDDITAEAGTLYGYRVRIRTFNSAQEISGVTDNVYAMNKILFLENDFLATKDACLKVKYNPDLTQFKRNIVDVITPTLGGAYPFVRRNGSQKYRTFNLGGLISYGAETTEQEVSLSAFTSKVGAWGLDSCGKGEDEVNWDEFDGSLFINVGGKHQIDSKKYKAMVKNGLITQKQKQNIYERLFRDITMDFLYNDHVLLFKSQQEGNIFIRLSNVSLSPDKKLDRNIYSFSATATEVLEANTENYLTYFSNNIDEGSSVVDSSIYILSAEYAYQDGALYMGTVDPIDEDVDAVITNGQSPENNILLWEKGATLSDNFASLGDNLIGNIVTQSYDTWGVQVEFEQGIIPTSQLGETSSNQETETLRDIEGVTMHEHQSSFEG